MTRDDEPDGEPTPPRSALEAYALERRKALGYEHDHDWCGTGVMRQMRQRLAKTAAPPQ